MKLVQWKQSAHTYLFKAASLDARQDSSINHFLIHFPIKIC